jgi:hypothetical protein
MRADDMRIRGGRDRANIRADSVMAFELKTMSRHLFAFSQKKDKERRMAIISGDFLCDLFPGLPSKFEEAENALFPPNLYDFLFWEQPKMIMEDHFVQTIKSNIYTRLPEWCDPATLCVKLDGEIIDRCSVCQQRWRRKGNKLSFPCTFNHLGRKRIHEEVKLSWKQRTLPGEIDQGLSYEAVVRLVSHTMKGPHARHLLVEGVLST